MDIHNTHCCAVGELAYIGHERSAPQTLRDICKTILEPYRSPYIPSPRNQAYRKPSAFYYFAAVSKHRARERGPRRKGRYGEELVNYIKLHNLGKVWQTEPRSNRGNHPGHMITVYMWAPDERALKAWWDKEKRRGKAVKRGQEPAVPVL